jgi:hypothetical protein
MLWFTNWWASLETFGQVLATLAVPATVVMVIQTLLLLFGGALGDDAEADVDADADDPSDWSGDADGLRLFTVRGLVALFAVGGWVGIAVWQGTHSQVAALVMAVFSGGGAMFFAAWLLKKLLALQESGNLDAHWALGAPATVYLPIPPRRGGVGRVTLTLQERFVEMEAVTDGEALRTGEAVRVVDCIGESCLVVTGGRPKAD